jgi:hypothetical protein
MPEACDRCTSRANPARPQELVSARPHRLRLRARPVWRYGGDTPTAHMEDGKPCVGGAPEASRPRGDEGGAGAAAATTTAAISSAITGLCADDNPSRLLPSLCKKMEATHHSNCRPTLPGAPKVLGKATDCALKYSHSAPLPLREAFRSKIRANQGPSENFGIGVFFLHNRMEFEHR